MNYKQKFCLWIGITVIVAMGIYPPWIFAAAIMHQRDAGYNFILDPPKPDALGWYPRVNIPRLCVQWVIVAAITTGLVVTFKDKKQKQ